MNDTKKEGSNEDAIIIRHYREGNGRTYILYIMGMLTRHSRRVTAIMMG